MVLSFADTDTLRVIENEFGLLPCASPDDLRARIVEAHMARVRAARHAWGHPPDTAKVTADLVRRWATNILDQFMIGHTDYEPEHRQSYKITRIGVDPDDTLLVQVTTFEGHDPRRFRLGLIVEEVAG